jgi:beta-lactamase superfamily II metal-dependent hydrolase
MAQFALDALEARKGDALVLRWGTAADPHTALIDGGPSTVWPNAIQPHLNRLAGTNPRGEQNVPKLDLVVVSHVDDDHINGIIDLANAVYIAQKQSKPLPVQIGEVWHNAFSDMQFVTEFDDQPDLRSAIDEAANSPAMLTTNAGSPREDPTVGDINAGAQSVAQGRQLDRLFRHMGVPRNTSFADRKSFVRDGSDLTVNGLTVRVLAPNTQLLDKLKTQWKRELRQILKKEADQRRAGVNALAAAFDDPSIPNQSSIVLLVEFEGKTMLLTGDARGDHILAALIDAGIKGSPFEVDVFKVPHHGSAHSNGTRLFEAVIADHYLISGNGEHGNPHPDALTALFTTQRGRPITLYLTNHPTAGARRSADIEKAEAAERVLDAAQTDPDVTIIYRDDSELGVTVDLS